MKDDVPPSLQLRGITKVLMKIPTVLYKTGLGRFMGRNLLLLTTTGRNSGRQRSTALSYHRIDDTVHLLSEAGTYSDWYRNLAKDPNVQVRIGSRRFEATADRVTDIQTVARVLRLFNQAYPRAVQHFHKIPARATDEELLALAPQRLVIALREKGVPKGKT